MRFYSTNDRTHFVSFRQAVIQGLAPGMGLYMPEKIPALPSSFFSALHEQSLASMAFVVAREFIGEEIPADQLRSIVKDTLSFDAPLVEVEKTIFSLELFHGPTLAFKDFGARFMSKVLGHFAKAEQKEIVILVATSGDTGSAVANGFLGIPGTRVVVLYPSGKVSDIQEKQFTTLGKNVAAIEVNGTFDDCQRMVKQAFADAELNEALFLTSANSINIARLIPQMFYYFYAWSRLPQDKKIIFSVPSGNFGNLTAGLIAKRMGLPIDHFVAATNANDIVPQYFESGKFIPRPSVSTISNAMDVGDPSNFARLLDLYRDDVSQLQHDLTAFSFSDEETKSAMNSVFKSSGYTLDPHGAVAYLGLKKYQSQQPDSLGVFLETAHPAKFLEVVESILSTSVDIPDRLKLFLTGVKDTITCEPEFESLKKILVDMKS